MKYQYVSRVGISNELWIVQQSDYDSRNIRIDFLSFKNSAENFVPEIYDTDVDPVVS